MKNANPNISNLWGRDAPGFCSTPAEKKNCVIWREITANILSMLMSMKGGMYTKHHLPSPSLEMNQGPICNMQTLGGAFSAAAAAHVFFPEDLDWLAQ